MGYKLLLLLRAQQQLWVKRYFVDVETNYPSFLIMANRRSRIRLRGEA